MKKLIMIPLFMVTMPIWMLIIGVAILIDMILTPEDFYNDKYSPDEGARWER